MLNLDATHRAAILGQEKYHAMGRLLLTLPTAEGWADLVSYAADWAHAARGWLAAEHDARATLKLEILEAEMGKGLSRNAAEKVIEEHPRYREAVLRMRQAEALVALAEARQRHADLRAQVAIGSPAPRRQEAGAL